MLKKTAVLIFVGFISVCYADVSKNNVEYINIERFVYDVALSKDEKTAYVTSTKGLAIVDLKTKNVVYTKVGRYPDHIQLSKKADKAFVSLREGKIAIVDLTTLQVSYIKVDGIPEQIILSNDERTMYIANVTIGLTVVDLISQKVSYVDIRNLIEEKYIIKGKRNAKAFSIDLTRDGSTLYLTSFFAGVFAVNTKDLTYSNFNKNYGQDYLKLSKDDTSLYISSKDGIKLVSLLDKEKITIISKTKNILDMKFSDMYKNTVYVADAEYEYGLAVIKNNKLIPFSKVKGMARKLVLTQDENTAYVADYDYGLAIVNLKKK